MIQAVKEQDETKYTNFDRLKSNDLKGLCLSLYLSLSLLKKYNSKLLSLRNGKHYPDISSFFIIKVVIHFKFT